jgi:hypothetical protein
LKVEVVAVGIENLTPPCEINCDKLAGEKRGILVFFLTAVFFNPNVLEKVAGRARKDRNVILRFVAAPEGTNEVLHDPTSAETPFASYFGFGRPGILMFFLTAVFFQPQNLKKNGPHTRGPKT